MTEHSLTATASLIYEAEDEDREFMLSAGLFDGGVAVYLRKGDVGDADVVLSKDGTSIVSYKLPAYRPLYAWCSAGTAKLCSRRLATK